MVERRLKETTQALDQFRAAIEEARGRAIAWMKCEGFSEFVKGLSGDEQARRLREKFEEIQGAPVLYNGLVKDGILWGMGRFNNPPAKYLQPLKGLPLKRLNLNSSRVSDLLPLKGMPLIELEIQSTEVKDLSPLNGAPLAVLNLRYTFITDLGPLRGMPLNHLNLGYNCPNMQRPLDLSPLEDSPLVYLDLTNAWIKDLSPVGKILSLRTILLDDSRVKDIGPLKGLPLSHVSLRNTKVTDLTPLSEAKPIHLTPPPREQLTPESLKLVEKWHQQGCEIVWE